MEQVIGQASLRFARQHACHAVHVGTNSRKGSVPADGVHIPVFTAAKTVADCFKYCNKIGLDVALEALRESWRGRKVTMDQLWHFAKVNRVSDVMRPYLEALVA